MWGRGLVAAEVPGMGPPPFARALAHPHTHKTGTRPPAPPPPHTHTAPHFSSWQRSVTAMGAMHTER
jgi:hypothetical protein